MRLYTPEETARFFRISPAELESLVSAQKMGFVEVMGERRFRCDHIIKFIRENTRQVKSEWLPEGA